MFGDNGISSRPLYLVTALHVAVDVRTFVKPLCPIGWAGIGDVDAARS